MNVAFHTYACIYDTDACVHAHVWDTDGTPPSVRTPSSNAQQVAPGKHRKKRRMSDPSSLLAVHRRPFRKMKNSSVVHMILVFNIVDLTLYQ